MDKMTLSRAIEILDSINGLGEIKTALQMGSKALQMQIRLAETLQEFNDNFKKDNTYSELLVMELLNDVYMMSEVNDEID